jgi:hypothetical protein
MSKLPDLVATILRNVLGLQRILQKTRNARTLDEARTGADEALAPLGEISVAANAAAGALAHDPLRK